MMTDEEIECALAELDSVVVNRELDDPLRAHSEEEIEVLLQGFDAPRC